MTSHEAPPRQVRIDDSPGLLHHALRVRDLCGLHLPVTADHPPTAARVDPRLAGQLSAEQLAQASASWPEWWRACLSAAYTGHLPDGPLVRGAVHPELNRALAQAGHPPHFASLDDRPALRSAARATWLLHQGGFTLSQWTPRGPRIPAEPTAPITEHQRYVVGQGVAATVVQEVADRHRVAKEELRAWLFVVPGDQLWWRLSRPGVAVLTTASTRDLLQLRRIVRQTVTSFLSA